MTLLQNITRTSIGTILLLLIPLAGTVLNPNSHFNGGSGGGSDWGPIDFLLMGMLLFVTGLIVNFAAAKIRDPLVRGITIAGIIFVLLVIWAQFAVNAVGQLIAFVF